MRRFWPALTWGAFTFFLFAAMLTSPLTLRLFVGQWLQKDCEILSRSLQEKPSIEAMKEHLAHQSYSLPWLSVFFASEEEILYAHEPSSIRAYPQNRVAQMISSIETSRRIAHGGRTYIVTRKLTPYGAQSLQHFFMPLFQVFTALSLLFLGIGLWLFRSQRQLVFAGAGAFSYTKSAALPKERERFSKKEALGERATISSMIEYLNEGVILLDSSGKIQNINLKAVWLLKLAASEFEGRFLSDLIEEHPTVLGNKFLSMLNHAQEQNEPCKESFEPDDDSGAFYEMIAAPLKKRKGVIAVLQDHSSDYKMLSMGKNFVNNASHELRTPITIIRGFTETLREFSEVSPEMIQDVSDKILKNCQRMASVVKSLLVLADLDYSGKGAMQPCDLVALIESCSHNLIERYPQAKVETFFNRQESIVWGDPDLLELAFMNLLENGVKYSGEDAVITAVVEEVNSYVHVSIRDHGVGISQENLKHIFERFYTVDKSHSRKLGGAGLGLSIVKSIVDKHEGEIDVDSTENKGTTFRMKFLRQ